jgi:hypothetical protein
MFLQMKSKSPRRVSFLPIRTHDHNAAMHPWFQRIAVLWVLVCSDLKKVQEIEIGHAVYWHAMQPCNQVKNIANYLKGIWRLIGFHGHETTAWRRQSMHSWTSASRALHPTGQTSGGSPPHSLHGSFISLRARPPVHADVFMHCVHLTVIICWRSAIILPSPQSLRCWAKRPHKTHG